MISYKSTNMPYNLNLATNAGRITNDEAFEIKYWAQILGCSIVEVIPAVKAMLKPTQRSRKSASKKS